MVIDANNSQVDGPVTSVTTLEPLAEKWRAFGWRVAEVDGHDVDALVARYSMPVPPAPSRFVVIARTEILGRVLRFLRPRIDGHFIKLDPPLERALIEELEARPCVTALSDRAQALRGGAARPGAPAARRSFASART